MRVEHEAGVPVSRTGGGSVHDAIVVGGGHNGLVAAALLARAGRDVLLLERGEALGGATVSIAPFAGRDARLSRYSYLVSLFPRALLAELGVRLELRARRVSSYTPRGGTGILVSDDATASAASVRRTLGSDTAVAELAAFGAVTGRLAARTFDSLTEPLRARDGFAALVDDEAVWRPGCSRRRWRGCSSTPSTTIWCAGSSPPTR